MVNTVPYIAPNIINTFFHDVVSTFGAFNIYTVCLVYVGSW